MKRRPYYLMPGVIACLVMTLALVVQAQTYDLTVTDDGQKVSLKADNASSYAIIQDQIGRASCRERV